MQEIGQQIRQIRNRKGISLNAYANELGVSSGYLSNLETGKTQNITLSVLEQLQKDLNLVRFLRIAVMKFECVWIGCTNFL